MPERCIDPEVVSILNVPVHALTTGQLHMRLRTLIESDSHGLVLHVNAHCLNLSYERPWLRGLLSDAEIVFSDGAGVLLAARILGYHLPARITYADWVWQLAEFAEPLGYTFLLLGAKPGIAERASEQLRQRFPNLRISGTHHGYFDKIQESDENEAIIRWVNSSKPNILVLGFGMPLQEKWLFENWNRLECNVALTGGAVFDYVSGELNRGPKWMTDNGFEWLARLVIEPHRLWRRYLIGNPLFLWRVLKQRFGMLSF